MPLLSRTASANLFINFGAINTSQLSSFPMNRSLQNLLARWRQDKRQFLTALWQVARKRLWYRCEKRIYVYEADRILALPNPNRLQRDRPEELRYYEQTASWQQSPDVYRATALKRLADGEHLYTLVEGNRLLHYAWLQPCHTRGEDTAVGQAFVPPADSSALYDHYTHPSARGQGLFSQALCQLLHDVPALAKTKQAYIYVYADNAPSRHVIEKIGFRYVGSLIEDRRLVTARRHAVSAGGPFKTEFLGPK
ncbi:MAG TPA: GNAT family N-acetyltransferase [Nitrospira sp.]|nr:GNAT family N-acetyltransferase [Nitrospira sp.]